MNARTTAAALAVALVVLLVPCARSGADDPPAPVPAPPPAPYAEEAKRTWEWMLEESHRLRDSFSKDPKHDHCGLLLFHWVPLVDCDLAERLDYQPYTGVRTECESTWELDVLDSPSEDALHTSMGKIVIKLVFDSEKKNVASPWISAAFVPRGGGSPVEFEPDLLSLDFAGYGGLFHQTFVEYKGGWFKLPRNPLPRPGWVHLSHFRFSPHVLSVQSGELYYVGKDTLILPIEVHPEGLTCRRILPEEDPCCDPLPPPLPENIITIPYSELYDADGHFRLRPACQRGC